MSNDTLSIQKLSLLFSRLKWPSALVRERACDSIADLLYHPYHGGIVLEHLLAWIAAQELESVCILGLLALHRAQAKFKMEFSGNLVWKSVKRPSILAWLLIHDLDVYCSIPFDKSLVSSNEQVQTAERHSFFAENVELFIPPIYKFWAKKIEYGEQFAFIAVWENEWNTILSRLQVKLTDTAMRYWIGYTKETYATADTILSEIYRSAFLRALARTVNVSYMSPDAAHYLAATTLPIDLSLWKVQPQTRPTWWPHLSDAQSQIDTSMTDIWNQLAELWDKRITGEGDQYYISQASGVLTKGDLCYEIGITGLFHKVHGPAVPELGEISRWIEDSNELNATLQQESVLRFDGTIAQETEICVKEFDDWSFVPAVSRVHPSASALRWQPWRRSALWFPSLCFFDTPLNFQCSDNTVEISQANSILGRWQDWTDAITERRHYELPYRSGQFLVIKREIIDEFARSTNSSFTWFCRVTAYYKKQSYSDSYMNYSSFKVFGDSSILRPDPFP